MGTFGEPSLKGADWHRNYGIEKCGGDEMEVKEWHGTSLDDPGVEGERALLPEAICGSA